MALGVNFIIKRFFLFFYHSFKYKYKWWENLFIYNFMSSDFFKYNFKYLIIDSFFDNEFSSFIASRFHTSRGNNR